MICSIRNFLAINGNCYAPAYIKLYDAAVRNHLPPGVRKMTKKRPAVQGIGIVSNDIEFDAEYEWVHSVWKGEYFFSEEFSMAYLDPHVKSSTIGLERTERYATHWRPLLPPKISRSRLPRNPSRLSVAVASMTSVLSYVPLV